MPILNEIEVLRNIHGTRASKFIRRVDIPDIGVSENKGFSTFEPLTVEQMLEIGNNLLEQQQHKHKDA